MHHMHRSQQHIDSTEAQRETRASGHSPMWPLYHCGASTPHRMSRWNGDDTRNKRAGRQSTTAYHSHHAPETSAPHPTMAVGAEGCANGHAASAAMA